MEGRKELYVVDLMEEKTMDKNEFIIAQPQMYLETQHKALEERLKSIKIDETKEQDIIYNKSVKTIRDKTLGLFKLGDAISTILNWNEEIDTEINEAKKAKLLEQYFNLVDNQGEVIDKLKIFLTNPQGNILFNKILRILDDNPPDLELIGHLSSALKYIVHNERFHLLFEKHKFALSQIENLSIQALTILSDYKNYPIFNVGTATTIGAKLTSGWNNQFVQAYCLKKEIKSKDMVNRISHVIVQLQTQGYIEAYKSKENSYYCEVTSVGKDLIPYLLH